MADKKTLEFKVKDAKGKWVDPRWNPVDAKNDKCPRDGSTMIVVAMGEPGMYAYCLKCDRWYIAE